MSRRRLDLSVLTLLLALIVPHAVHAQAALSGTSRAPEPTTTSCLDRIPDGALVPQVLYLYASAVNDLTAASRAHVFDIDVFAQHVAERMRELLHAPPDALPAGEPAMTWRTRESEVHVVVDPAGHFEMRPADENVDPRIRGDRPRSRLLGSAVDSLRAQGQLFTFTGLPPDSLAFDLNLALVALDADGKPARLEKRAGFAVATLWAPPETTAAVRRMAPLRYPERQRQANVEAVIHVEFVVDTTGRADPATIHEFRPTYLPPLTAVQKFAYVDFFEVVRESIRHATFEPATIGGCAVRQLVRQPFTFGLSGR